MNMNYTCTGKHTVQPGDTLYSIAGKYEIPIHTILFCNKFLNPYNLQIGEVISIPVYPTDQQVCDPNGEAYIIRPGDTLYFVANKYNTSVDDLMRLNPGIDPYNLMPGMQIRVTSLQMPTPSIPVTPIAPLPPQNLPIPPWDNIPAFPIAPPPPNNIPIPPLDNIPVHPIAPPPPNNKPIPPIHQPTPPIINRPTPPTMPCNPSESCDGKYHMVRKGDTLTRILMTYNYSYAALLHSNPSINFSLLQPGMRICIPKTDQFNGCPGKTTYIIKMGDTLSKLANNLTVTTDALLMSNPSLKPSDFTVPGSKICVPEQGIMPL